MFITRCCDRFYNLNLTAIAEDRVAIDGIPATFCPYCGTRIKITVEPHSSMEYPIENSRVLPRRSKKRG